MCRVSSDAPGATPSRPIDVQKPSISGDRRPDDKRRYMIPEEEKKKPNELERMTQVSILFFCLSLHTALRETAMMCLQISS